ncbi:hypothetical protein [Litoreibacter arenae]|uniref:Uncharacterized protein n=1 Tax=Litoreibacter arenae DSM 19593 TaxID=1123360 RepID=S9QLK8_9RHOB|nr:hypothetical protein [Litoreibacter arenae]EPX80612.1 Hypothetical protein in cluster with DNA polymerase III epsilon subunit [Litoreibacter arenae DSM 19593]
MFFELIGTLVAGAAVALIVWAVNRTLKGRLPSWLVPVSAGAAMLLATISSEYSWFSRTQASMPGGMVVADKVEERVFYRPWTYAKPFVSRFVAVDRASLRTHPEQPEQKLVDLVFYGRWTRTAKIPVLFDCAAGKRADIVDGIEFGDEGEVTNAQWRDLSSEDPILRAACKET